MTIIIQSEKSFVDTIKLNHGVGLFLFQKLSTNFSNVKFICIAADSYRTKQSTVLAPKCDSILVTFDLDS